MKINNNTPQINMNMQQTISTRKTVNTSFGASLKKGLSATANVVGGAASMGIAQLPGGNVISAALSKAAGNIGSSSSALTAGNANSQPVTAAGSNAASNPLGGVPGSNAPSSVSSAFAETKKMFEMQAGFNLKFLQLQNKMQHESRSFQTISNVMKNRTDTAKNSIRNIN